MRVRTGKYRLSSWVGITALLLQAMIPFAQSLPGPGGVPLVICKVAGLGASTQQQPVPARGPGAIDGHGCVVCVACAGPTATAASVSPLSFPHPLTVRAERPRDGSLSQQHGTSGFKARAPPFA